MAAATNATIYIFTPPSQASTEWGAGKGRSISGSANFKQVIYVDDQRFDGVRKFVAIADSSTVWFSSDGENWTVGRGTWGDANFNQIIYAQHMFVIAADSNTVWKSGDGESWVVGEGLSGSTNLNQIIFSGNHFEALGMNDDNTEVKWYSMDGRGWDKSDFPFLYIENTGYFNVYTCIQFQNGSVVTCANGSLKGLLGAKLVLF